MTASRTDSPLSALPLAVTVQELEPLQPRGPGVSLAEQVGLVPGLLVRNRFNAAQGPRLSIRGFGARSAFGIRGLTVLLDGIPLTLADGLAQIDLVEPELLGKVEVVRGPAGALYGNAAGGVLYLESAAGEVQPGEDIALRVGEGGLAKLVVRAAEPLPMGAVSIGASVLDQRGWREHAHAQRWILHGASRLSLGSRSELRVNGTFLESPEAFDPGALTREELQAAPDQPSPNALLFDTGESVTQGQVGALVEKGLGESTVFTSSAYYSGRDFVGSVPFRYNELDRNAFGGVVSLRSVRPVLGRPLRLAGGLEGSWMQDRRRGYDNEGGAPIGEATLRQDERVQTVGGYGQAQLEIVSALTVLGGLRYDLSGYHLRDRLLSDGDHSDSRTFGPLTGMAGATLRLQNTALLWLSYSDAYETPTITELSLRPDGRAGFVDDLSPQRARSAELGSRAWFGPLRAEASAFSTWLQDELVPFSDETGRTYYRNAGRSHRQGVELATNVALPLEIGVGLAWSWLHARFDEYVVEGVDMAGKAVPGLPPHHGAAQLSWGTERGPFVQIDLDYLHSTWVDDANAERSPAQAVMSARAGWRGVLRPLRYEIRVGVENLLDSPHVDTLRVNASDGRFYEPGWPRLFHAGVTLGRAALP